MASRAKEISRIHVLESKPNILCDTWSRKLTLFDGKNQDVRVGKLRDFERRPVTVCPCDEARPACAYLLAYRASDWPAKPRNPNEYL